MNFFSLFFITSAFITTAWAQASRIGYPPQGAVLTSGTNVTVQVIRPFGIEGSIEVGLAIAFQSCADTPCLAPKEELGTDLFAGQYNPTWEDVPMTPYENFTVALPQAGRGSAVISIVRAHLFGAGLRAELEINTVNVTIA